MNTFKIILPARDIPTGSIVTKPTGSKEYMLKREIKISGSPSNPAGFTFTAGLDRAFIVDKGDIRWTLGHEDLLWKVDSQTFLGWLEAHNEEDK